MFFQLILIWPILGLFLILDSIYYHSKNLPVNEIFAQIIYRNAKTTLLKAATENVEAQVFR